MDIVNVLMRFLHIISSIVLIGGVIGWCFAPANTEIRGWRPAAFSAIAGLLISGTWNFLHKTNLPPSYHAIFGIKALLALHVFAVVILATKPGNLRRQRQLTGVAISGVVIVLLSAVLRSLTLR